MILSAVSGAVFEVAFAASRALAVVEPTAPPKEFDPNSVTPGVAGFVATILFAAAVIALILDMSRRIRRTRYRAEIAERLDAEQRESALLDEELTALEHPGVSAEAPTNGATTAQAETAAAETPETTTPDVTPDGSGR